MYQPEIWRIQENINGWLWIIAPVMINREQLTFGEQRGIVKDLRELEKNILDSAGKFHGWIAHTKIENAHIIHLLERLGAKPYDIDREMIWFKKKV